MSTLTSELDAALAIDVRITKDDLTVYLADGRTISAPIAWYPRLAHGAPSERKHWELIGDGEGVHWPDLDEDISVAGLLSGRASGESQRSFKRWLESRASAKKPSPRKRAEKSTHN